VGSSDADEISASPQDAAADLAELADMLAPMNFRVAYENWCWSSHAPSWKDVWDIVKLANRPNLGLCLDTFQAAGAELADPTTDSGYAEGRQQSFPELKTRWKASLENLTRTVPPEKIFVLQISDAYKMSPPLKNEPNKPRPKSQWSHDYRPLPGHGGYLPVKEVLRAVLATGFDGYLSVEVFDWKEKEGDDTMEAYTSTAMRSLEGLLNELKCES
jgi:sugar phosphate isomerase/epimerase